MLSIEDVNKKINEIGKQQENYKTNIHLKVVREVNHNISQLINLLYRTTPILKLGETCQKNGIPVNVNGIYIYNDNNVARNNISFDNIYIDNSGEIRWHCSKASSHTIIFYSQNEKTNKDDLNSLYEQMAHAKIENERMLNEKNNINQNFEPILYDDILAILSKDVTKFIQDFENVENIFYNKLEKILGEEIERPYDKNHTINPFDYIDDLEEEDLEEVQR